MSAACSGYRMPSTIPRPQALTVLDGFPFEQIQKFRANMAMRREGRPRTAADELHHPAIGGAQIFDFHAIDNR